MYLRSITILRDKFPKKREYPFIIPSIRGTDTLELSSNVTFFVGENGTGKSTLLEAIAYQCGFPTAGGGKNNFYHVESSESSLGDFVRLSWLPKISRGFFLRAESFYQFASYLDQLNKEDPSFGYEGYGGKSLHEMSHGESFLSLFRNRFGSKAIYLLDEPEAALSPARQLSLLRIMKELDKHAQFIIATHSPIILAYPGANIFNFDETPVSEIKYEETMHYHVTRRFLENRKAVLKELFDED